MIMTATKTAEISEIVDQIEIDEHGTPKMPACKRNTIPFPGEGISATDSFEKYCKVDAANASTLKRFCTSGLHGAAYLSGENDPPSREMLFGTACHTALFEPEEYKERAKLGIGSGGKPLADGCAWSTHKKCQDKNPGALILRDGWKERIEGVCHSVRLHSDARFIFQDPNLQREFSVYWLEPYEFNGRRFMVPCKVRYDLFSPLAQCYPDLKVTGDASPREFSRWAYKFGYYQSGGWYKQAGWRSGLLRKVDGQLPSQPYPIIAVERESVTGKPDGHLCAVYNYTDADLDQGFNELMSFGMSRYLAYRLLGRADAPDWCNTMNPMSIPTYAQDEQQLTHQIGL